MNGVFVSLIVPLIQWRYFVTTSQYKPMPCFRYFFTLADVSNGL